MFLATFVIPRIILFVLASVWYEILAGVFSTAVIYDDLACSERQTVFCKEAIRRTFCFMDSSVFRDSFYQLAVAVYVYVGKLHLCILVTLELQL